MIQIPKIDALTISGFLLLVQIATAITIGLISAIMTSAGKKLALEQWFDPIAMITCLAWSLVITFASTYATGGNTIDFMNTLVVGAVVMLITTGSYNVYKNTGLKSIVDLLIATVLGRNT